MGKAHSFFLRNMVDFDKMKVYRRSGMRDRAADIGMQLWYEKQQRNHIMAISSFCIGCILLANHLSVRCENCNSVVTTRYCQECGEYTGIHYGDCPNCGEYTDKDYCGNCGTYQIPKSESNKKDESNSTTSENKENHEPQKESNSFIN